MSNKLTVLSLGWGVQSFTIAAMVALGELEPIDFAIHADTTHEGHLTYEFANKWASWLAEHGVEVKTVKPTDTRVVTSRGNGGIQIPAYTSGGKTGGGQLHRQCTGKWKITPMRRLIQSVRNKRPVEQWIGISIDEYQRMKMSDVQYITHRWPLIEKKMSRTDCKNWLIKNGLEIPPRSSCTFCPFHNTSEWRQTKKTELDWQKAMEIDSEIRSAWPPFDLFVHPARKPLDQIDFRSEEEKGQLSLWDNECTGICGV